MKVELEEKTKEELEIWVCIGCGACTIDPECSCENGPIKDW